jgi:hypothetical protein
MSLLVGSDDGVTIYTINVLVNTKKGFSGKGYKKSRRSGIGMIGVV